MGYKAIDFEDVADDIITLLKANLNTKITAINSEKNDGISLDAIDTSAYLFHTLDEETVNYNPFILCEFINAETVGDYGHSQTKVELLIGVVLSDSGSDLVVSRRLFRYQRAMREVIEDNFDSLASGAKMIVQSQVPVELTLSNGSFAAKAIALSVRLDLG